MLKLLEEIGEKILKRLVEEKLASNHIHGLILQLYQLKRYQSIHVAKSSPSQGRLNAKSLIAKYLVPVSCPLISAQCLDVILLDESYDKVSLDLYVSEII